MTEWADIERLVAAEDVDGIVRALLALDENERRSFGRQAARLARADGGLNAVAGVVVWGTGSRPDVERVWAGAAWRYPHAVATLLEARRPDWLEDAIDALCTRSGCWPLAHDLFRRGLFKATGPGFVLALLGRGPTTLDEDPTLIDRQLWRLFEVEGGGEVSLAAFDKYSPPPNSWATRLVGLAAAGRLDRSHLIDATLDALGRGFSAFRAGWFMTFHDTLVPTDDERRVRLAVYLDLLGSPTPQIGAFALRVVAALDATEALPAQDLIDSLPPAVVHRNKGTATRAVALLGAAARRSPGDAQAAALVAADALLHESPDVQRKAIDVIKRHGDTADPRLQQSLSNAEAVIAPSLREVFAEFVGKTRDAASERAPDHAATGRTWPAAVADAVVLEDRQPIVPITTIDELALALARVLEHPDEPDQVERVIDAISRLPEAVDVAPAVFRPMRKRADRIEGPAFRGRGVLTDVAGLVECWVDAVPPAALEPRFSVMDFFSARMHAIATRVAARETCALLSAPTHTGGWIDPRVLVTRDASNTDEADRVLALLRLAPCGRSEALAAAEELDEPLAYALGASNVRPSSASPVWVAAARSRFPGQDAIDAGEPLNAMGAGAATVGTPRLTFQFRKMPTYSWRRLDALVEGAAIPPSPLYPTISMRQLSIQPAPGRWDHARWGTGAVSVASVRWCATVHPADPDPLTLEGLVRIGNNLDWDEAVWHDRAFLEPLLTRPASLSDIEVQFLAIALDAKEPGIQGLASEITGRTLLDGRLTPERLGRELGRAWSDPYTTPRRYARSLAAASAVAPAAVRHVRRAMLEGLTVGAPHTDVAAVLELLNELCSEGGVRVDAPAARMALEGITGAKGRRLARELLSRK